MCVTAFLISFPSYSITYPQEPANFFSVVFHIGLVSWSHIFSPYLRLYRSYYITCFQNCSYFGFQRFLIWALIYSYIAYNMALSINCRIYILLNYVINIPILRERESQKDCCFLFADIIIMNTLFQKPFRILDWFSTITYSLGFYNVHCLFYPHILICILQWLCEFRYFHYIQHFTMQWTIYHGLSLIMDQAINS